ncbi:hypothetical protein HZS_6857 [Henneguya salminicola]|nr:hypothetical protein HZS_6857 [Henneguya salminicola]
MATMLNGAAVMDAALLLVAGNEPCPQPQSSEHLAAIEIMRLSHILILQNKIDLIKMERAKEQYDEIAAFKHGTIASKAPVIPISAQLKYNIDAICEYICQTIPTPVGMEIEVRPGIICKDEDGTLSFQPIFSTIVSLFAEQNTLEYAVPGGLIGVGTLIDPVLCRSDRLVGQVLGAVGSLPCVYIEIEFSYYLLRRIVGIKTEGVGKFVINEIILVNIGSQSVGGRVLDFKSDVAKISVPHPVCTEVNERIALSRRIDKHWRYINIFSSSTCMLSVTAVNSSLAFISQTNCRE